MTLTKEKWEWALTSLRSYHSAFRADYLATANGKNAAIRKSAQQNVQRAILLSASIVSNYPEIYSLLVGESIGQDSAEKFQEFKNPKFYDVDMPKLLKEIEKKIAEIDNSDNPDNSEI